MGGPLFEPGRNCWRVETARRAAVIIDACDYYHVIREAMLAAKHRILIIGWDFDPRIKLDRLDDPDETLGDFLLKLARDKPDVAIDIPSRVAPPPSVAEKSSSRTTSSTTPATT